MRVMLATNAADLSFEDGVKAGLDQYWADVQKLFDKFGPMFLSTKLDGVRGCIANNGHNSYQVMSRTWKPIASRKIQEVFAHFNLHGLDGEFIAGGETDPNAMQASSSATSKRSSTIIPTFNIFDYFPPEDTPYTERYEILKDFQRFVASKLEFYRNVGETSWEWTKHVKLVNQELITNALQARERVEDFIAQGYEGGMLRLPTSPYKRGRSTLKEGYLLKLKIWADADARILYAYEAQHNGNKLEIDERGYAKRSSARAGKIPAGYLGGYHVQDVKTGAEFDIGIAVKGVWTLEDRKFLWESRNAATGQIIKYRYFPTGIVDKPRFPKFVAFRDQTDI